MAVIRNPNLGPSQMRQRRRRLFYIRATIVIFILLIIIFTLAIFSGHNKVTVNTITVSGNASVSENDILSIANRDMAGRYFYLFSKKNFLIFPRFQIREDILTEFKTVNEAEVSWAGWGKILISVSERKPDSVWCGADPQVSQADCYFVDKTGYIYSQARSFSGSMFVRGYGQLSDIEPLGQYFLPTDIYKQIFNLVQILDKNNIMISSVYTDGIEYRFTLESGPEIIFNNKNSFNQSFQNLFSAIETGNLDLKKDSAIINYIDLRFDNKIVVGKKEIKAE